MSQMTRMVTPDDLAGSRCSCSVSLLLNRDDPVVPIRMQEEWSEVVDADSTSMYRMAAHSPPPKLLAGLADDIRAGQSMPPSTAR